MDDLLKTFDSSFINIFKVDLGQYTFEINLNRSMTGSGEISYDDWHSHPILELHYMVEGVCSMLVENVPVLLEADSFILIEPNVYHVTLSKSEGEIRRFSFSFSFYENTGRNRPLNADEEKAVGILAGEFGYFEGKSPEMKDKILSVAEELEHPSVFSHDYLRIMLESVMILMLRRIHNANANEGKQSGLTLDEKRHLFIDYYFNEHFSKPETSAVELALYLNISTRHLDRILKSMYRCSFSRKLNSLRIQKAEHLLRNSSRTVDEIAEGVGYTSTNYFYELFRKITGTTPAKYRRQHIDFPAK